jgi:hypothetical protein
MVKTTYSRSHESPQDSVLVPQPKAGYLVGLIHGDERLKLSLTFHGFSVTCAERLSEWVIV